MITYPGDFNTIQYLTTALFSDWQANVLYHALTTIKLMSWKQNINNLK